MRKKIVIIANNDVGLYKFRKELIETLLKKYEVHILLPYGEFVDSLISMGCTYHQTELNRHGINPAEDLKLLGQYKKLIRLIRPEVVLTYTIKPNIYGGIVCAGEQVPCIANITGLGTAVEKPGVLQFITVSLYRYALRKNQKVFFQNEANLAFMRKKKIVKDNFELIPGSGVNLQQYLPSEYPAETQVHFLFVARIMKEKGIDQYLEAARYIRKKYPETCFHICGACEQEYRKQLERHHADGTIVYHGQVADMIPLYNMCSCLIHPTYYPEGMSNVLLESCACARPIITTDRSGCREIIDDGVNGFIIRQKDSRDLIEKIEAFLSLSPEERRNMGLAGRAKVEREFDRQVVVNTYLKEIEKVGRI